MLKNIRFYSVAFAFLLMAFSGLTVMQSAKASEVNAKFDNFTAKSIYLADYHTGEVIYEKKPLERLHIASMVKIMTLNLIFDEIEWGNLSYDSDVIVSEHATSMGGSQAFLDKNGKYKAGELIKSIIVASANDSCVAMAEHIGGSVENFVEKMNAKAKELGMNNTYFVNCTGLPAPNQYSCSADAYKMMKELITHDGFFDFSTVWNYEIEHSNGRKTQLTNTNKLSRFYNGCDGGKTGFTSEAKSCLSATAKRGETRLICVVIGAENSKTRNAEVSQLLNYGFANFETKKIYSKGEILKEKLPINGGKVEQIEVVVEDDLTVFTRKGVSEEYETEVVFDGVNAPILQGSVVGKINLIVNGEVVKTKNLIAKDGVESKNYFDFIDEITQNW
ncbi:MAG: D-alanyl-D-alanine carboxypeptidase [Clostridia bacterium]|nr:D-alanyl-D-alanine carboxypeptidase [Clostridia bacterium]